MNKLWILILAFGLVTLACEPEEEQIGKSGSMKLAFSSDTVLFDTLLSSRTSLTKRFRIYNPNNMAVEIEEIRLAGGALSDYSIIINGKKTKSVQKEVLFGGDSLQVLVDVDIDPQDEDTPYLVKDSVEVSWNGNQAHVKLVAWGQDAHYLNGQAVCDETWTADRPYVIYNLAMVEEGCKLSMEPGTRVYLDNGASFIVAGSLEVKGDTANPVVFRNTRFDENYQEAPGQWGGIVFMASSTGNTLSHAVIENGQIGIGIGYDFYESENGVFLGPENSPETADITIDHTIIRHMSTAGIFGISSEVYAWNTEVYDAGSFLVANFAGGTYRYEHCTFSNVASHFNTTDPMMQFADNIVLSDEENLVQDLSVSITNSILWGQGEEQLLISNAGGGQLDTTLVSNLIRSEQEWPGNYVSDERDFPGFADPLLFDFSLDSLSFARDKAKAIGITDDLLGMPRDEKPDIGAYERIDQQ
ncbi:hypothetical protein [Marinoscillum furvescens]|nr:hypothetical protein [Marinoscillum furvescens]